MTFCFEYLILVAREESKQIGRVRFFWAKEEGALFSDTEGAGANISI